MINRMAVCAAALLSFCAHVDAELIDEAQAAINFPLASGGFGQSQVQDFPLTGPASAATPGGGVSGTLTNYLGSGDTLTYSADSYSYASETTLGTYSIATASWGGAAATTGHRLEVDSFAGFQDTQETITGGTGQGILTVSYQIDGSVTTSGATFAPNPDTSNNSLEAFERVVSGGPTVNQLFTGAGLATFTYAFTFGTPFEIVLDVDSVIVLDTFNPGTTSATVDFYHTITPVDALITDSNGTPVVGATLGDGLFPIDPRNQAAAPEPGSAFLLLAGLAICRVISSGKSPKKI